MSLRAPLPAFPIPLREGEPEIQVELQPPIKHAYVAGAMMTSTTAGRLSHR